VPSDPHIALVEGKTLLGQGKRDEAVAYLMHTFREGSPDVRQEASRVLEELGEMNFERAEVGWRFLLWWVLASTVGLAVGGVVPFLMIIGMSFGGVFWAVDFAVGGAVFGASVGIAQWPVLRGQVPRASWWVLASTVGMAVGWAAAFAAGEAVSLAMLEEEAVGMGVAGVVVGASVGIAQWLVLRGQVSRASWWVLVSTVGSAVSAAALVFGLEEAFEPETFSVFGVLFVILISYGAFTGTFLVWLLLQPVTEEPIHPQDAA
jgi:hypothetical protein